jgi:hypothetical protein
MVLSSPLHELQATSKAQLSLAAGSVQCPAICIDFCNCHQHQSMERQDLPCTYLAHEPKSVNIVVFIIIIIIFIIIIIIITIVIIVVVALLLVARYYYYFK